ncbi:cathepsin L1-like isoform X1 [Orbicella faveolata]|uniref:cathepsin L1-like isoform X1 n=1 Tax=Orbicella faveolata TaxID=48498 RepID=UPI0009E20A17|nr:cathepsin L1-like isoform X1 [Orbicella faveolata]
MKGFVAFLLCLTVASGFVLKVEEDELQWKAWKSFHGKSYLTKSEETMRKAIWRDNLKTINEHNSQGRSYRLAMNHFGDLTQNEFSFLYLRPLYLYRFSSETKRSGSAYLEPGHVSLPTEVDWRKEGYVTEVKDQGHCGSCWAFSATGSLEGQHFKKTGKLVSLSEQNLVDCSRTSGNLGCQGGFMDRAFDYIIGNHGVDTEASYPYVAKDNPCRFQRRNVGATMTGYVDIPKRNETTLHSATATVGPISVAIDASVKSFRFYSSGVYDEPSCSSEYLDHGVLVVGYGTYQDKDYWLVKNSWGTRWGMEGYIMMSRNKDNQCGIATLASYPLV